MNLHSLIASVWSKSLPRCEVYPCLKQGQYLNFKSLEWGVNPQPLSVWAFAYKLSVCRFEYHCWNRISLLETSKMSSGITPVWTEEFLDIQATIECEFTLKWVCVMIRTCSPVSLFFMSNENKMQLIALFEHFWVRSNKIGPCIQNFFHDINHNCCSKLLNMMNNNIFQQ